ncbi:MAG: YqaE/Pmp3 family membrane protein [Desulfuromonas sp.]
MKKKLRLAFSHLTVAKKLLTGENEVKYFKDTFDPDKRNFYGFIVHSHCHVIAPLGVFLQVGIGKYFWISIVLTLLRYISGIVHAVWVLAKGSAACKQNLRSRSEKYTCNV